MWRDDDGSALMLMPAAVLILMVLAAIAVDAAILFTGERQIAGAVAAAANDAAGAAVSPAAFYACGEVRVDAVAARRVAAESYVSRSHELYGRSAPSVSLGVSDDGQAEVTVRATGVVDLLFTKALPGVASTRTVDATAVATVELPPGFDPGAGTC